MNAKGRKRRRTAKLDAWRRMGTPIVGCVFHFKHDHPTDAEVRDVFRTFRKEVASDLRARAGCGGIPMWFRLIPHRYSPAGKDLWMGLNRGPEPKEPAW